MSGTADADVLVVGAGPAGSSLALRLARRGARVELADAREFPRSKPCGDCLSPGATPHLRELGVMSRVEERAPALLRGWRVRTPGGTWFEGDFEPGRGSGPPAGVALSRRELDAALLDGARAAGARFRPRARAVGLLRRNGRVAGARLRGERGRGSDVRARLVVGADGLRSTVARRIGGVRRGPRDRLAVVGRFRADRGPDRHGEMRLGRDGCLGLAPVGRGLYNACLMVPRDEARKVSRARRAYYRRRLGEYGLGPWLRAARLQGELEITGPFEIRPRRVAVPGALLVGDAAGYFDPLTGQGIYRALASSRLAAATALRVLEDPAREGSALLRYRRELEGLSGSAWRLQRWVDRAVTRPAVIETLGGALSSVTGLASLFFDVTGDRLSAAALADPRRLLEALVHSRRNARAHA